MRKILAGLMATAMVTSLCATATMAVTNQAASATFTMPATTSVNVEPTAKWHNGGVATADSTGLAGLGFAGTTAWGNGTVSGSYTQTSSIDSVTLRFDNTKGDKIGEVTSSLSTPVSVSNVGSFLATNTNGPAGESAKIEFTAPTVDVKALTGAQLASGLGGQKFSVQIDGKWFSGQFVASGSTVTVKMNEAAAIPDLGGMTITLSGKNEATAGLPEYKTGLPNTWNYADGGAKGPFKATTVPAAFTPIVVSASGNNLNVGQGGVTADVSGNINIKDAIVCDGEGNPIPFTVDPTGVDKALNDSDGVQSKATVYFIIKDTKADGTKSYYNDDKYYKVRVKKGDNAKQISSASEKFKNFSANLYDVTKQEQRSGTSGRQRVIAVELNENYTMDEFKITLDMALTPTQAAVDKGIASSADELKVKDFSFYMKNIERTADNDWRVGINGLMLKPMANDWNDVTWYDEDGDVAHMRFFGDSDIKSFFSKLSTKWVHEDYAAYFNDQDAYYFEFTGSPKMSSTSRADLEIYNPFTDIDGNETIDPSTATIYLIVDGDLVDVTDSFTYGEADNGENAFKTRTRFIGSYIICEKPIEQAVDGDIDDLMPDDQETPATPGDNTTGGGKGPANTGRYN